MNIVWNIYLIICFTKKILFASLRFEKKLMSAYLNIRNKVNAYDFVAKSQKAVEANNQINKLQYRPDYTFDMNFSKTSTNPVEFHLYVVFTILLLQKLLKIFDEIIWSFDSQEIHYRD